MPFHLGPRMFQPEVRKGLSQVPGLGSARALVGDDFLGPGSLSFFPPPTRGLGVWRQRYIPKRALVIAVPVPELLARSALLELLPPRAVARAQRACSQHCVPDAWLGKWCAGTLLAEDSAPPWLGNFCGGTLLAKGSEPFGGLRRRTRGMDSARGRRCATLAILTNAAQPVSAQPCSVGPQDPEIMKFS